MSADEEKQEMRKEWRSYWKIYGGFSALVESPYSRIALVLTCLCFGRAGVAWWAVSAAVSFLGYFLFLYAIVLVFAASLWIFRMGQWATLFAQHEAKRQETESKNN